MLILMCFLCLRSRPSADHHPLIVIFQALDVKNFISFRNLSFRNAVHFSDSSNYLHKKTTYAHPHTRSACLLKLLILLAGDVELNPGPRKPKFPCIECGKACTWKSQAVCCDDCDGCRSCGAISGCRGVPGSGQQPHCSLP